MVIRARSLNIYLALGCVACLVNGCSGPERAHKRVAATLAVHLETGASNGDRAMTISLFRNNPLQMMVEKNAFISEAFISEAHVISVMDGFAITIQFDRRGSLLLEQYSAGNRGRRLAIHAEFGKDLEQNRWLGAPLISKRISDGVLTFTPDATREEADQIVLGLNNVAKKVHDKSPW
jgi:preprotein translocase subunit SecD